MTENKKFKYQNVSETEQVLIGFGKIEAGGTIETDEPIHNPNFKLVGGSRMVNVEAPVEQPKATRNFKGNSK